MLRNLCITFFFIAFLMGAALYSQNAQSDYLALGKLRGLEGEEIGYGSKPYPFYAFTAAVTTTGRR